jgi:leucyl-tRNA synthetase
MKIKVKDIEANEETSRAINKLIKNTTEMMQDLKLNTSVSQIMIFVNHLKTLDQIPVSVWEKFIKVFAPFAPFTTEELWQEINGFNEWDPKNSVHVQAWPEYDPELAKDSEIELPIQINGKMRGKINISADLDENAVKTKVLSVEKISKEIADKEIKRFIYIPNKIVNIVI